MKKYLTFNKFKVSLSFCLLLIVLYITKSLIIKERLLYLVQFTLICLAFIFYKPKPWETSFNRKNLINWLRNGVGLYLVIYFLLAVFYLTKEGLGQVSEIIKPGFFLGTLVINVLIGPILFITIQAWKFIKK